MGKAKFADTHPDAWRYFSKDNNGQYSSYAKSFGFNEAAMQPVASQNDGDGNNVEDDADGPATVNGTDNTTSG